MGAADIIGTIKKMINGKKISAKTVFEKKDEKDEQEANPELLLKSPPLKKGGDLMEHLFNGKVGQGPDKFFKTQDLIENYVGHDVSKLMQTVGGMDFPFDDVDLDFSLSNLEKLDRDND